MSRGHQERDPLGVAIAVVLDRRRFMRAAGGTLAATTLPLTALAEALPTEASLRPERLADWTIDDVWGGYPRYAEAIGHGRMVKAEAAVAVDPVDLGLVT